MNTHTHIKTDGLIHTYPDTRASMSEDKAADGVETSPAEAIPNGKGHEAGEEITALPNTPPEGEGDK